MGMWTLKFLWLVVRPFGKAETIHGWYEVFNLIPPAVYVLVPIFTNWESGIELMWFTGTPALLFLIAGARLQFRLSRIENEYHYALSIDNIDVDWEDTTISFAFVVSNVISRAIEYEVIATETYIEIDDIEGVENMPHATLGRNERGIISAGKSDVKIKLPEINKFEYSPRTGTLFYKLVYGCPDKPLFQHEGAYSLKVKLVWENGVKMVKVSGEAKIPLIKPIKKLRFGKIDS